MTDIEKREETQPLEDYFKEFIELFRKDGEFVYLDEILRISDKTIKRVDIDWMDLASYDMENGKNMFGEYMELDASYLLTTMAKMVYYLMKANNVESKPNTRVRVSIHNTMRDISIREINSDMVEKFVCISGMMIRMSSIESIALAIKYGCREGHDFWIMADKNLEIWKPVHCTAGKCKNKDLEEISGIYEDYQIIDIQEKADDLPAGMMPMTTSVFVMGDLVNKARIGELVEIGGVVKAELSRKIKLGKEIQTHRQRIHANTIRQINEEEEKVDRMDEINKLRALPEDELTTTLVNSFAPHIYGNDIIKESIMLSMISAETILLEDGTKVRGDINIFLVGDPGTAKSEMGKAGQRIAPRALYTSGKGASSVGLTAATIKDNITGAYVLEPGIVVLADRGIAIIDEFDKMKTDDRSALHEAMEQGSVSVARGGINATLNARTAIIAIANPIFGRYDPFKTLVENVKDISIPLLTRFDLIFILRDIPQKSRDKEIIKTIMNKYTQRTNEARKSIDSNLLKAYVRHAKTLKTTITKEAEDIIGSFFLKLRTNAEENMVTVRQLEGLIRLTIARARLMLKDQADKSDAERAIYIMTEMFKNSSTDPETGKLDLMTINTGKSKKGIQKQQLFIDIMEKTEHDPVGLDEHDLIQEMIDSGKWNKAEAQQYINKMSEASLIYERMPGKYRLVQS